jgi:tetratricopeptide (TPR) repeat protein
VNVPPQYPPAEIDRLRRSSEAAWARYDYESSERLLKQARALSPQDPRLLLDLGFFSTLRYDYAKAAEYFEQAIQLTGGHIAVFRAAGWHCLNASQPIMALGYFERALEKFPAAVEILGPLAGIHERQGNLDLAEELASRAARLAPDDKPARLVQAKVRRRRNQLTEAETILRAVAGRPAPDPWASAQIWYELGFNLDGQARYDEAMAAFLKAKEILRPATETRFLRHQAGHTQLLAEAAGVTRERLQRFHDAAAGLQPPSRIAFLAGHPRSGTTLLEHVLDAHEDVVALEEAKIFDTDAYGPLTHGDTKRDHLTRLEDAPPGQIRRVRKNYFAQAAQFLGEPAGDRLLVDKNPMFTIRIPAITRIFPEAKFMIALRDPRDVCLSCFMQALPPGTVNLAYLDLGRTVEQYGSVLGFWLFLRDRMAAPWMEIRYEDMVAGLDTTARRTLDFLGLPWDGRVLAFDEHARSKFVRSPTYADVAKPIYQTAQGRWRNYQKHLEPHLARLEPFIRAFGYA